MLIKAKTLFRHDRNTVHPGTIIDVDEQTADTLIQLRAAEIFKKNASPAVLASNPGENPPESVNAPDRPVLAESDAVPEDEMEYTTSMNISELRAAMKAHGFTVRVGMTKREMVETLNGDVLPDLSAMDVVDE